MNTQPQPTPGNPPDSPNRAESTKPGPYPDLARPEFPFMVTKMLTSSEAAAYLGISVSTLFRRHVKHPDPMDPIPFRRFNIRCVRFLWPELADWAKRQGLKTGHSTQKGA